VVRGLQAPSGHDQICHKPVQSVADLSLDSLKVPNINIIIDSRSVD